MCAGAVMRVAFCVVIRLDKSLFFCAGLIVFAINQPACARAAHLSAEQLFAYADAARDRRDFVQAEKAYRALTVDKNIDLRCEARFRLAVMLAYKLHRLSEAGVLLRQILDERPNTARVRLELARIDVLLGRTGAANRELRAAEAVGLPPAVEQQIRFFAQALDASRPFGGSLSISLAPDTNVNHATNGSTLNTVLGNFTLSNDAQARSGIGLTTQGQAFARLPLSNRVTLLAQLSGSANVYRTGEFNDFILAPQIGPQIDLGTRGRDRLTLAAGSVWRWYGNVPYSLSLAVSGNWQHALNARSEIRIDAGFAHIYNRRDNLETGDAYSLGLGFERAWSGRAGGGLQFTGSRQTANDPGYANASGAVGAYVWHEIGKTTLSANLGYSHLEADARLFLFPSRRIDNEASANIGATFRQLRLGAISPLLRFRFDKNWSTVQLYQYQRFSGEIGIATSF